MASDAELLRQYVRNRNEAAFTELVRRHINLVYSSACRETGGDSAMAQDVTQLVFIELARKSRRLTEHTALGAWLYTSVRHVSSNLRRAQQRRAAREQKAQIMKELPASPTPDAGVENLEGVLDDALHEFNERDRGAVVLRFLEGNNLRDVGAALGLSEDAARMRVDRALEKLRTLLAKRGVTSTASGLTAALAATALTDTSCSSRRWRGQPTNNRGVVRPASRCAPRCPRPAQPPSRPGASHPPLDSATGQSWPQTAPATAAGEPGRS